MALGSIGLIPPEKSRIVRIKNTLHVDEVEVSEVYREELKKEGGPGDLGRPQAHGLRPPGKSGPLVVHGGTRKGTYKKCRLPLLVSGCSFLVLGFEDSLLTSYQQRETSNELEERRDDGYILGPRQYVQREGNPGGSG